jgi:hypothetical protein
MSLIMGNKRSAIRTRTLLKGVAIFNNRQSTADCLVRNMSASGARLRLWNAELLPEHFDLIVPHKAVTYRARIAWRGDGEIGVVFETAQAETADPLPRVIP